MSDGMWTCGSCGARFTHVADLHMHIASDDPACAAAFDVSRPAVDPPRVPTYRPILPPVQPQSLEVHVTDSLIGSPQSPTGLALLPKWVPNVLALIATVAGVIVAKDMLPDHTLADQIAKWIVVLSGPAGIASQGVRK